MARLLVMAGHIRRGEIEAFEAALLLCDLRGFTDLSNRLPGSRVLELLDSYFDRILPAITREGGEVIKFMGDAVLAAGLIAGLVPVLRAGGGISGGSGSGGTVLPLLAIGPVLLLEHLWSHMQSSATLLRIAICSQRLWREIRPYLH